MRRLFGEGTVAPRKVRGAVPHDMGAPSELPLEKLNAYNFQDVSRWKDLGPKFVLQVVRDYAITGDRDFAVAAMDAVEVVMERTAVFDFDKDGLIENEGYPDQTYDIWSVKGPSAYTGGLWLAALKAAAHLADILDKPALKDKWRATYTRGKVAYEEKLWDPVNGYYHYDASGSAHSNSIMTDQLAGHWYARACGLDGIVDPAHARSALKKVFDFNVCQFNGGQCGAVNGMTPQGKVDHSCMQSQEVWTGTTYAAASAMLGEGLIDEGFRTGEGIQLAGWNEYGYFFQTPEGWFQTGTYRSLGYMRPLCIWAMQWMLDDSYIAVCKETLERQNVPPSPYTEAPAVEGLGVQATSMSLPPSESEGNTSP